MPKSEPKLSLGQILAPGTVLPPMAGSAGTSRQHRPETAAKVLRTSRESGASRRRSGRTPAGQPEAAEGGSNRVAAVRRPGRFDVLNRFTDVTMGTLSDSAVRAWLILYRDTKPDGLAKTGYSDLARRMGCSVSTTKRAIRELKRRELIVVVRRGGPFIGPSTYQVFAESPASRSGKVKNGNIRERAAG